jgi:hypothetical protein
MKGSGRGGTGLAQARKFKAAASYDQPCPTFNDFADLAWRLETAAVIGAGWGSATSTLAEQAAETHNKNPSEYFRGHRLDELLRVA